MVVVDETKLSPAVSAAVLQLGHETLRRFGNLWHQASDTGYRSSDPCPRSALTTYATAAPEACLAPPIFCYFGPADCNLQRSACSPSPHPPASPCWPQPPPPISDEVSPIALCQLLRACHFLDNLPSRALRLRRRLRINQTWPPDVRQLTGRRPVSSWSSTQ